MPDLVADQAAVSLGAEQLESLREQLAQLGPDAGRDWMAVLLPDGQVFVRGTRGLPQTLIRLWRKHPAMMVPGSAGYRPNYTEIDISEL